MKNGVLAKIINSKKNLIVNGNVSSGKTMNVLFPLVEKFINSRESVVILDSKEEYINKYYNLSKELGYNSLIINLKDLNKSEGWNPLTYPYDLYKNGNVDKSIDYLEKLGKIIFYGNEINQDRFWISVSTDLFIGVALGLFDDAKEEEINFSSINYIIKGIVQNDGLTNATTKYFKLKDRTSPAFISAAPTIFAPKATQESILSVAIQKLNLYTIRKNLELLLNKTTFNYDDILSKPTAIFIVAREDNRDLNSIVAMFIEQLYQLIFDKNKYNKFNFILDNIDVIDYFSDLNSMIYSGSSINTKFYIGTRLLDDLVGKYGSSILKMSNIIKIKSDKLELNIDNHDEVIQNDFESITMHLNDVEYPKLFIDKIYTFDLKKYLEEKVNKKKENVFNNTNFKNATNIPTLEKEEVNKLLEDIDNNISLTDKIKKEEHDIRSKVRRELTEEIEKRSEDVHSKKAMKSVFDTVSSYEFKYYFNKMDRLEIYDNIVIKLDRQEVLDNLDTLPDGEDNKVVNFSITIDNNDYKGYFTCSKLKLNDDKYTREETYVDEACPYKISVSYPNRDVIDINSEEDYIRFFVLETKKHDEFARSIYEGDLTKYKELATELINEAKCYAHEERLAQITATVCKNNNLDDEPYAEILDELYESSKYGKEVMENNKIPDDNTGNEELDKQKRNINQLKEEILFKIKKLEDEEIKYRRKYKRFILNNNLERMIKNH